VILFMIAGRGIDTRWRTNKKAVHLVIHEMDGQPFGTVAPTGF
jgi:hypothetical protein